MLNTGLGNHSKIQAHGELFHPNPDERFCETKLALPYQEPAHGDAFLEGLFMLAEGSCWPRCSGFKLFYQQAQTGAARSAWTWLERNTDVHIIHLVRANLLDSWVSWEVAQRTDQWFLHRTDCVSEPPEPFDVDVDKCEKFFDWVEQQREWTRHRFARHPWIELEYEGDLVSRWSITMTRLHDFLELPHETIQPVSVRQQARPVRCQISNYDVLEQRWSTSRWAAFLEHGSPRRRHA